MIAAEHSACEEIWFFSSRTARFGNRAMVDLYILMGTANSEVKHPWLALPAHDFPTLEAHELAVMMTLSSLNIVGRRDI
jgi:hypothetical protein